MRQCDLKANGSPVTVGSLTQWPHDAASCDLLLNVTPTTKKSALAAFKREGELGGIFSGLRISGFKDLSFLKDFPDLLYLEIDGHKKFPNLRDLECLKNLRGLGLQDPGAGLDFACFPELGVFFGDWHPDNRNIGACQELRRLSVSHYKPATSDVSEFVGLTRLEDLSLVQSNIASLDGIEALEDLRYLQIAYSSKLESLDALAKRESGIREIDMEVVKRIASYEPIGAIPYLRRLHLLTCAPMSDLKWTARLKHLDFFTFVETNVLDGDLSPLLRLPRLRQIGTFDKKHYSHTEDELEEALAQRSRDLH